MYMTRVRNQAVMNFESSTESQAPENIRDIYIYSSLDHEGYFGISARELVNQLNDVKDLSGIELHINSEGGDVIEGIAIYNLLKNCGVPVNVHIEGLCASAASLIAMSGEKIIMHTGAFIMIHNPFTIAWGDSEELKQCADVLDKIKDSCVDIYVNKTGLSRDTINDLMNRESWMGCAMAKELGFADEIDESKQESEPEQTEQESEQEQEPQESESIPENKIKSPFKAINLFPVKNKSQDKTEAAINLMAGYINGKRNH